MKKIYIICIALIALLAIFYTFYLMSIGCSIRQCMKFFAVFIATAAVGAFIIKLCTKKIRKSMEDN